jgi:hypothetical protein
METVAHLVIVRSHFLKFRPSTVAEPVSFASLARADRIDK